MRKTKTSVLLTSITISLFGLLGCDKLIGEPIDFVEAPHDEAAPGCESEDYPPHPYVSCTWPEDDNWGNYDPACVDGCGGMSDGDGTSYAWCNVECVDVSDCEGWDAGGSALTCDEGRCKWYCDEDLACPSELECVERGDPLGPNDNNEFWGECLAPDPFAP